MQKVLDVHVVIISRRRPMPLCLPHFTLQHN